MPISAVLFFVIIFLHTNKINDVVKSCKTTHWNIFKYLCFHLLTIHSLSFDYKCKVQSANCYTYDKLAYIYKTIINLKKLWRQSINAYRQTIMRK